MTNATTGRIKQDAMHFSGSVKHRLYGKDRAYPMQPTLDNDRPIFLQVKEAIEDDILAGLLAPDDQIPSNSQLVSFFSVNPVTVHRGVSLLFEEGIVYKKRGLGMFVSPNAPVLLRKRERDSFEQDFIAPLTRQAVLLGIDRDTLHACIDRSWTGAGQNKEKNDHD